MGHAPAGALAVAAFLDLLPSALGFVIRGYAVTRLPMSVSAAALYLVPPARSSSLSGGLRRCPTSSN
ncbi:hypothetical protein [Streptomyces pinistramenti]|uniref:hypothetical protein n=1 Tax=Streptomyces pinistramenti TaxID=2884812 RepID=UPI001D0620A2|nr:hypothetical protein [Streptomyces pinistramenti]